MNKIGFSILIVILQGQTPEDLQCQDERVKYKCEMFLDQDSMKIKV